MTPRDMALAVFISVIWGLAFVATKLGLDGFSAPQLTALRFIVAALPVLVLPRPRVPWTLLIAIGLTLFAGQFVLLFFAYTHGIPPGVASVTQQMQVFFTVPLAAVFFRDVPTRRQSVGMAIALCGLVLIGLTAGGDLSLIALGLALASALSWAIGNVLVKSVGQIPMVPLIAWASLVAPVPALILSVIFDSDPNLLTAMSSASWIAIGSGICLGTLSTNIGYAAWSHLLARYPTALVTPFALLVPCTGVVASALIFNEKFSLARYLGMTLIISGIGVVVWPRAWAAAWRHTPKN
jgi:O-acetylserine/cysteine efflux transporter